MLQWSALHFTLKMSEKYKPVDNIANEDNLPKENRQLAKRVVSDMLIEVKLCLERNGGHVERNCT